MNWHTFFSLDGVGPYLWGSYGVCFGLMLIELLSLRRRGAAPPAAEDSR